MPVVFCKTPKAGLGNQLFPIIKAFILGYINKLPVKVFGYNQLKIGPYLRNEKTKRNYNGYFSFQKGLVNDVLIHTDYFFCKKSETLIEPSLKEFDNSIDQKSFFISQIPHWSDYFKELKPYRETVIKIFYSLLNPKISELVKQLRSPYIGVHIRMGDYRKLKINEDFKKVGLVRTPEEYFVEVINQIRKVHGSEMPVSIFSDGYESEFDELQMLGNVQFVKNKADILDLITLSKSKIIVTSAGSTFSYWAGFLADCPLIIHPDHIHSSIRPLSMTHEVYEGPFDLNDKLLVKNIKAII